MILTPLMAPRANAYAERWIGSCRRECLDWILVVNQHLQAVIDDTFPLEEAPQALARLEGRQVFGKLVVMP